MKMKELPGKIRDLMTSGRKDPYESDISQKDLIEWLKPEPMQKIVKDAGLVIADVLVTVASSKVEDPLENPPEIPTLNYRVTADSHSTQSGSEPLFFAIGSLMKLLINLCLYRMVEHGSEILAQSEKLDKSFSSKIRDIMINAWDKDAFELLNELRKERGRAEIVKPINPFLLKRIIRHNGLDPMYEHIFAPNGDFLMSPEKFKACIVPLTETHRSTQREWKYSNCNHMLACLIICEASNRSLADTLQTIVLDKFHMNNTFLHHEKLEEILSTSEHLFAKPHVIDMFGVRHQLKDYPKYFNDDISLATGGGYSCTRDFYKLFRVLMAGVADENSKWKKMWNFGSEYNKDHWGDHFFGINSRTHSIGVGLQALDPISFIKNKVKPISMGKTKYNSDEIQVYIKGGAVKGYNCHYFLIPMLRTIIIVFTNGSGIIDASNYIGQYILKQILQTKDKLDFMKAPERIFNERKAVLQASLLNPKKIAIFEDEEIQAVVGTYENPTTEQRFEITSDPIKKQLDVVIRLGPRSTRVKSLRLVKCLDRTLRIAPREACDYGPDTYVWWSLSLSIRGEAENRVLVVSSGKIETDYPFVQT
jgi:hypothetical protein